ncbi:MAG: exodeoxyribonuclease VII small subunit [Chlamydiales bacterium]|nr:exodeoxyribonuclease VII small subunit [Chlamydiales bacterium]
MSEQQTATFEAAYARLEQILEKMNSNAVSLDESIKLYEEADRLIVQCQSRLSEAEQKIEVLIKNRDGTLQANEKNEPVRETFTRVNANAASLRD